MTAFIDEITAGTEGVDAKPGAWRHGLSFDLVAKQRPVRTFERLEQTRFLPPVPVGNSILLATDIESGDAPALC